MITRYKPGDRARFDAQLRYARALEYDHDNIAALKVYDRILKKCPHIARAHVRRAYCVSKLGDNRDALSTLQETLHRWLDHPYADGDIDPLVKGSAYYKDVAFIEDHVKKLAAMCENGYVYRPTRSKLSPFKRFLRRISALLPRKTTAPKPAPKRGAYPSQLRDARGTVIASTPQLNALIKEAQEKAAQ